MTTLLTSREYVWLEAWKIVCKVSSPTVATEYADKCLEDFDKRFPNNIESEKELNGT